MAPPTDEELLAAAARDGAAFGVFYARHARVLHAFLARRTGSAEVAFDLTAEAFARALRGVESFDPGRGSALAWLFGIARNVLSESVRHGRVEDRTRRRLAMEPVVIDDDALRALEANAHGPALDALDRLPAEQRVAILARHVEGLGYDEIARDIDCSESVVRQRVSRGLRTLRARLGEAPRP